MQSRSSLSFKTRSATQSWRAWRASCVHGASIKTIFQIGDSQALNEELERAFPGAKLEIDVRADEARFAETSQICLTTHAESLATTIARLTRRPAVHLEKVDGETRVVDAEEAPGEE